MSGFKRAELWMTVARRKSDDERAAAVRAARECNRQGVREAQAYKATRV